MKEFFADLEIEDLNALNEEIDLDDYLEVFGEDDEEHEFPSVAVLELTDDDFPF